MKKTVETLVNYCESKSNCIYCEFYNEESEDFSEICKINKPFSWDMPKTKTLVIENWETIGAELRAAREAQNKTRVELVDAAGKLHVNTLDQIENNKVKPTLPTLAELIHALGYEEIIIKFGK